MKVRDFFKMAKIISSLHTLPPKRQISVTRDCYSLYLAEYRVFDMPSAFGIYLTNAFDIRHFDTGRGGRTVFAVATLRRSNGYLSRAFDSRLRLEKVFTSITQ